MKVMMCCKDHLEILSTYTSQWEMCIGSQGQHKENFKILMTALLVGEYMYMHVAVLLPEIHKSWRYITCE